MGLEKEDLYKIDYEKGLSMLQTLADQKIAYQKSFIFLISGITTVSLILLKVSDSGNVVLSSLSLSLEVTLGILFFFVSLLGFMMVRSLTSIRVSEVFFNNTVITLRDEMINSAGIKTKNYPNLVRTECKSRKGSDYFTIAIGSIINLFFLLLSCVLIFGSLESVQTVVIAIIFVVLYVYFHIITIEKELENGDKLWSNNI